MRSVLKTLGTVGAATAAVFTFGTAAAKDITVAYVAGSMQYPYNVAVAKGFETAAKELGMKTVVLDPRGSVEKQGNAIDDLIAQKVDGITAILLDSVVARTWVDRAADKGIPFVASAVQVGDPDKVPLRQVYPKLTALVTTDDVLAGQRAGELAATMLPKGKTAKIGIIEGAAGYAVVRQRTQGFRQGLDNAKVKYEIVASQPTDWTPEKGESVCQNILTANPDLDLFFSQADDMAIGCSRAIRSAGAKTKLIATGGGSRLGNAAIRAGELDGSVCTSPEAIGRIAAQTLHEAITKKNTAKGRFITYDIPAITKATLDKCSANW